MQGGGEHNIQSRDWDVNNTIQARLFIRRKLASILVQVPKTRALGEDGLRGLVVGIEKRLFCQTSSLKDFVNLETLKDRVAAVIKHEAVGSTPPKTLSTTGSVPASGALGQVNGMKSTCPEVNTKDVNILNFESKTVNSTLNSWTPQHVAPAVRNFVDTRIEPIILERRDKKRVCNRGDSWHYNGTLEDMLHPRAECSKMMNHSRPYQFYDIGTSQPWDYNMHQILPPDEISHVYQQLDAMSCNGKSGSSLTGLLEDIVNYPLKKSRQIMKHPPLSDSSDNETAGAFSDITQSRHILQDNPTVRKWNYMPILVKGEEPKIIGNSTAPNHEPRTYLGNPEMTDHVPSVYLGKPKINCSLAEVFTLGQIKEHIDSLRQWVGERKVNVEKKQAMSKFTDINACQLCSMEDLPFASSVCCSCCCVPIKLKRPYYTVKDGTHRVCTSCYKKKRTTVLTSDGCFIYKSALQKICNNEETKEPWVQCNKCDGWQHEICALFNPKKNEGGVAEYICPKCLILEIKSGERVPLPQEAVLGAKDLPTTSLSDHIEKRLLARLTEEREERAKAEGKRTNEVPGAEDLIVRVVLSIEKKSQVKEEFLDVFSAQNYPIEFPYTSKVILLFQKIEGVDVCLFAMYIQEYGSQCASPNKQCVYLSYLDSVKYFRPEIKTVNGEALRTFVYHQILIGYLDYCKNRGFLACYIWQSPPSKGDSYILYCHPEIQKAPEIHNLKKWYDSMLAKARKENVVVGFTTLYTHFFDPFHQCKITATRLPYFDGDYWPDCAEQIVRDLKNKKDEDSLEQKGNTLRRRLDDRLCCDLSGNHIDKKLMERLGGEVLARDDFTMVQLQYFCRLCCEPILFGRRWSCIQCKDVELCERCFFQEHNLEGKPRHYRCQREKHDFSQVEMNNVAWSAEDNNEIINNKIFQDRRTFLDFSWKNHYQHDMLRRAKHSSMMILHHLHNPTSEGSP